MHPSGCALRRITGLRYPHHTAHAEACLHSATATPAPSRFLRRRRRSTPQPLAGEPFQVAVAHKASPARGGAAAGGGGVRRLALPLPFRTAAACVGADALHRPASLRHRKAHGTMQASSLRTQGKALPGFGRCAAPPQVPQRKNSPAPGLWVRGCFSGMRAGRLGVSGRRIPGWLSPKQRLPVWRAEHWPGHRRRHRAATADASPPEFVPPPRCRPPAA